MAAAVLDDWTGFAVAAPNGSLTISSGSDRALWLVYIVEVGTTHTYTSMTVGGQTATDELIDNSTVATEQYIWSWYWDEAAIAAMSGTTVTLVKTGSPTKHVWDYITFSGATSGAEYATSVEAIANNSSITTASNSSLNDFIAVAINRSSANRDVTDYDNLTEGWQRNTDFTACVADGAGGDDTVSLTGDGFSGNWLIQGLHVKASTSSPMLIKALQEGHLNG